ncbi:site-specific integrase [Rhodobium orientis]|nr:site-specific integrase [Rhodobium orientis]
MSVKLTKKVADAATPRDKDYVIWDSVVTGFGLKVTPAGSKIYILYYRSESGRQRRPSIGKHGAFTVDQARQTARKWLNEIASGKDVSAERQSNRRAETVAELAARYLTDYAEAHKKPRSIATDRANIENHVVPLFGSMKVKEVTRADIDRVKLDIRGGKSARRLPARPRGRRQIRGGKGIANRVLALLSKMFACAVDWGLRADNPVLGVKKFAEQRKDRFLDADEIHRLTRALERADREQTELPAAIAGIRLLLYTGLRLGEVLGLRWDDIDFQRGTIRLRDSKTGARTVPLNGLAMDVLRDHREIGGGDLILEGLTADKPVALTRPWYRIRQSAGIDDTANLHCLRHTFASWAVMSGQSLPQVGALLGHKSAQTTLRYADHAMDALQSYSEQTADRFRKIIDNT